MKLERLLGLLAMTGITLLALFLFFPSRHTDDISSGCVYLASDEASFVTGTTLHINGGMGMF